MFIKLYCIEDDNVHPTLINTDHIEAIEQHYSIVGGAIIHMQSGSSFFVNETLDELQTLMSVK